MSFHHIIGSCIIDVIIHMNNFNYINDFKINKIQENCLVEFNFINNLSLYYNDFYLIIDAIKTDFYYNLNVISITDNNFIIEIDDNYYDIRGNKNNNYSLIISKFIDIN